MYENIDKAMEFYEDNILLFFEPDPHKIKECKEKKKNIGSLLFELEELKEIGVVSDVVPTLIITKNKNEILTLEKYGRQEKTNYKLKLYLETEDWKNLKKIINEGHISYLKNFEFKIKTKEKNKESNLKHTINRMRFPELIMVPLIEYITKKYA